jgi:hypothetical protein
LLFFFLVVLVGGTRVVFGGYSSNKVPCSGGGGQDLSRWVLTRLGLMLALSLLRWSEGEGVRSSAVFFFNEAAETGSPLYLGSTAEVPLAGHGGEVGFIRGAARYAFSLLLAGLGGEGELKHGLPVLDRGTGPGLLCR